MSDRGLSHRRVYDALFAAKTEGIFRMEETLRDDDDEMPTNAFARLFCLPARSLLRLQVEIVFSFLYREPTICRCVINLRPDARFSPCLLIAR